MFGSRSSVSALAALFLAACLGGGGEEQSPGNASHDDSSDAEDTDTAPDAGGPSADDEETDDDSPDAGSVGAGYGECSSDQECDDGLDCTRDTCEGDLVLLPTGVYEYVVRCRHRATDDGCPVGSFCLAHRGCVETKACSDDEGCADDDGCTVNERCEPASRTCRFSLLDGDRDGEPPPICGGLDCNDNLSFMRPGQPEVCNDEDDNCNGEVDEGIDTQSDPDNCGMCRNQ